MIRVFAALVIAFEAVGLAAADRPDLVVEDFEAETYGEWTVEGAAFGEGPAKGTLPGQMRVEGFEGERLVNSFVGGDGATGTLTSPAFKIDRKFLNFLIGGGGYAGETCIDLLIDGKVEQTATGPNVRPGGSERLDWRTWDVAEFAGREAVIRIVDRRTGGWGHVNVDQIVQSDARRQAEPASREMIVETRYLNLPVKNGAAKRRVKFVVDGETAREFEIELADGAPDLHVFSDVSAFAGKTVRVEADALPGGSKGLDGIAASDGLPAADSLYGEVSRPQFHFTSRRGWLNDPNGLVCHDGEWHLFYQHNPYGVRWGNMHWGHAVSRDLMRWEELPIALYPREFGDWAFSGSAVVDRANTSGFGVDGEAPLVLAYTSTGRGECVAYSNDRGRTWTEFEGNPVVRHKGRDPKLIWHEPTRRWVMAVYQERKDGDERDGRFIAFYSSPDLKAWTYESRIEGFFECPDLFRLPIGGKADASKWVLYAADGEYVIGEFDGKAFRPDHAGKHRVWHGDFYAAQTYDNAPDGRRVQIGWGRDVEFPGMPFNQQMAVPVELTLRPTKDGPRMFAEPVREIETLRDRRHVWHALIVDSERVLEGVGAEFLDVQAEIRVDSADSVGVVVRGVRVTFDAEKSVLTCGETTAPLRAEEGVVRLRVLADRGSVEVFANGGAVAISEGVVPSDEEGAVKVFATGGRATFETLEVYEMKSTWRDR